MKTCLRALERFLDAHIGVVILALAIIVAGNYLAGAQIQQGAIGTLIGTTRQVGMHRVLDVILNDLNGAAINPALDATDDAPAPLTGPGIELHCDDTSTNAVDEEDDIRARGDCKTGALYVSPMATENPAAGTSPCYITSAASTNATNCKNAPGNVYLVEVINTTSTIYYLRLYNLSSSPTCSSSTGFVRTIPIPQATAAGSGFIESGGGVPEGFSAGIGFCLTGGGSSTDNTNAGTGVYATVKYK